LGQPTADGPSARQVGLGEVPAQDDANQLGPPLGVLLPQGVGLLNEFGSGGLVVLRSPAIVRGGRLAEEACLTQEMTDRALGQLEALGQGRGVKTVLAGADQSLPDGEGDGSWHASCPPQG
jgi:hypothetical protein